MFIKKQATINDDVLDYTNDLEDRIENGFDDVENITTDHTNKLTSLLSWMGLVKDYVVDSGFNARGEWKKYESGLMIQYGHISLGNRTLVSLAPPISWLASVSLGDYPLEFVGDLPHVVTVLNRNNNACWGTPDDSKRTIKTLPGMDIYGVAASVNGTSVTWTARGRWK